GPVSRGFSDPEVAEDQRRTPQFIFVMAANIDIEITRDPTAPAAARRAIEQLEGQVDPALIPDMKLLVSELITNSVKYGGTGEVDLIVRSEGPQHAHAEGDD